MNTTAPPTPPKTVHIQDSWGRSVTFVPKQHPTRPELASYYSLLGLWLVAHDGYWTIYTEHNCWLDVSEKTLFEYHGSQAMLNLMNKLNAEVVGPWTEDARRQTAAELLADLEAT